MIRVRFAPSPTGPLHIGGVRTALFNFFFARQHNGKCILRIEDTDSQRFVEGAEEYIIDSLSWCGLAFDEGPHIGGPYGPYRQSERKDIYLRYALKLIDDGHAYYAFDSSKELEEKRKQNPNFQYDKSVRMQMMNSLALPGDEVNKRIDSGQPYVIRIKIPDNNRIEVDDLIRGHVTFDSNLLDDKVIFKSDGLPTYHLANIVDDHMMEISHVIRGEEWLPSAPLHILLYQFLGWKAPVFAHLPLILKPQGNGKLSKRDGDKMGFPVFPCNWKDPASGEIYQGYREWGYLPEAFVNMLALLGWNPGTVQEVFTMDQLIKEFSLDKVHKSGAKFDPEKTKWFNHQYILNTDLTSYIECFHKTLLDKRIQTTDDYIFMVLEKIKDRMFLLTEFWQHASYFFEEPMQYNTDILRKHQTSESAGQLLFIAELLGNIQNWNAESIEGGIKKFIHEQEVPAGKIFNILRVALTGTNQGIGIADIINILGKENTIQRIQKLAKFLQ
jgi:glutamyl-tRNA synthetase